MWIPSTFGSSRWIDSSKFVHSSVCISANTCVQGDLWMTGVLITEGFLCQEEKQAITKCRKIIQQLTSYVDPAKSWSFADGIGGYAAVGAIILQRKIVK